MLELKDFQEGEIYYLDLNVNENPIWIQKWKSSGIEIKKSKKYESEWNTFGEGIFYNEIRLATEIEKAWLNHCIKEDKFVTKEEFLKQYKQEFIVGRWYKCTCNDNYYKYKDGNFNSSEVISPTGLDGFKKGYNSKGRNNHSSSLFKEYLTDLTEIQQYLPDEHVDKINTKEMSIQEIQEECKKRFPIGCKFKNTEGEEFTLIQDHSVYKIVGNNVIWASSGYGYLYDKGKYAELIETPEKVIPEYVEYIDTLYKGTIVKVEDWCCGSYCKVIFYNGNKEQPFKHLVKYSTKSAYDLQNLKQLPLTPEQCYNTEIEVGDEVENIDIQQYNGAVCTEKNNYTEKGIKGIVTKKGYSVGADCIAYEITWHNGKKCGKSINQVKLIKKANKNTTTTLNKKVDVSSPKVTDKITVPRINTTSYDTLVHINIETNTKSIKIPKLETNTPEIKKIKIQSLTLTI
jgi:hypothetical protein